MTHVVNSLRRHPDGGQGRGLDIGADLSDGHLVSLSLGHGRSLDGGDSRGNSGSLGLLNSLGLINISFVNVIPG